MSDAIDATVKIPASAKRIGPGAWEAWPKSAGASGLQGKGATRAEALANLSLNAAWVSHCVGHQVVLVCPPGAQMLVFLATVGCEAGTWNVFNVDRRSSMVLLAPSLSALSEILAERVNVENAA